MTDSTARSIEKDLRIIFFIDDDLEDTLLFETAVYGVDNKITFVSFTDGKIALASLRIAPIKPDIILLDINMPGMTGFECLKLLKENSELSHIPVVIFTTSKDDRDRDECMRLGAHRFVSKPNSFFELDRLVKEILHETIS